MTSRIFHWLGEPINVCDCDCHRLDMSVRHIVPCCDICYKQYITSDNVADVALLNKALEDRYNFLQQQKAKNKKPIS